MHGKHGEHDGHAREEYEREDKRERGEGRRHAPVRCVRGKVPPARARSFMSNECAAAN